MLEFYQFCRTRAAVASFIIVLEVNLAVIHFQQKRTQKASESVKAILSA